MVCLHAVFIKLCILKGRSGRGNPILLSTIKALESIAREINGYGKEDRICHVPNTAFNEHDASSGVK
jgi:hypothetical protein